MPSKHLSPEILASLTSMLRDPATLRKLGMSVTKEERKIMEGYQKLQEGEVRESLKAFQSAGSVSGEALVAFYERRYERALNRGLKGLRQDVNGELPVDDVPLTLWILKRGREHLPEPGISGREMERQQRVMAEADEVLSALRTEDWNGFREHIRELSETYPGVFQGLVEIRTNRAYGQRMEVAAYRQILEEGDFHRAETILELGAESRGDPSPFPMVGICPHCLPAYLEADKERRTDPWWVLKRVMRDVRAVDPGEVKGREEALLTAVSAVHIGEYLRRTDPGGAEDLFALAKTLLERLPTLGCARKASSRIPVEYLRGVTGCYLGMVALGRGDFEGARKHYEETEAFAPPIWAKAAEEQCEALEDFEKLRHQNVERNALQVEVEAARKVGDEARELQGLERLATLDRALGDENQRRRTFLRVVSTGSRNPEDLETALRSFPGDPRVAAVAWAAAEGLADRGDVVSAVRLLRRAGSQEGWTAKQLKDYADWARRAGWTRTAAHALTFLARKDASHLVPVVEVLVDMGEQETAAALILELVSSGIPDTAHRREVYEASLKTRSAEAMEAAARGYVEVASGEPEAEEAARLLRVQTENRARESARVASVSVSRLADKGDWSGVEAGLRGVPHEHLDDRTVGLLGRALEELSHPQEAATVYGERTGHAVAAARCWLKAGSMGRALDILQGLSREDEETPSWLADLVAGKDENLTALAFLAMGQTGESLRHASDPWTLERIAFRAKAEGHAEYEMAALGRLNTLGRLPPTGLDRLTTLRDGASIGRKVSAGPPLPGERCAVLCDTNVLIDLLVSQGEAPGLGGNAEVAKRWEKLHGAGRLMIVPPTVRGEFLARVADPGDTEASDEVMEGTLERARKLVGDMTPEWMVRVEMRPTREHLRRAEDFFSRHSKHLAQLTEKKVRADPSHEEEIRRRRTAVEPGDGGSGGSLPELGDIWLLASALRLLETPVPRVCSVAIFSDDRDFRDLRDGLWEAFGIEVL